MSPERSHPPTAVPPTGASADLTPISAESDRFPADVQGRAIGGVERTDVDIGQRNARGIAKKPAGMAGEDRTQIVATE